LRTESGVVENGKPFAQKLADVARVQPQRGALTQGSSVGNAERLGLFVEVFHILVPFLNTYRTMCLAPEPAFRVILEDIRDLHVVV
jgi:hypothetical protein